MMLLHTVVSSLLVNTCWTSTHSASSDPCIHYNADPDPRPYWAVTKLILKKSQYWFVSLLGSESASSTRIRIEEAFHNADPDSKHCSHYFYICSLNFYLYIFSHTNFSVWAGALILNFAHDAMLYHAELLISFATGSLIQTVCTCSDVSHGLQQRWLNAIYPLCSRNRTRNLYLASSCWRPPDYWPHQRSR